MLATWCLVLVVERFLPPSFPPSPLPPSHLPFSSSLPPSCPPAHSPPLRFGTCKCIVARGFGILRLARFDLAIPSRLCDRVGLRVHPLGRRLVLATRYRFVPFALRAPVLAVCFFTFLIFVWGFGISGVDAGGLLRLGVAASSRFCSRVASRPQHPFESFSVGCRCMPQSAGVRGRRYVTSSSGNTILTPARVGWSWA